jgi:hypothetical protein
MKPADRQRIARPESLLIATSSPPGMSARTVILGAGWARSCPPSGLDLRLDLLDDPGATGLTALIKSLIIHDGAS